MNLFPVISNRLVQKVEIRDGTDVDQSENRGRRFQSKSRMQCQKKEKESGKKTYDVQGSNEILLISTNKENRTELRAGRTEVACRVRAKFKQRREAAGKRDGRDRGRPGGLPRSSCQVLVVGWEERI